MLSLRSAFSRFILSGAICCAIVLGLPIDALATVVDVTTEPYLRVTNTQYDTSWTFNSTSDTGYTTVRNALSFSNAKVFNLVSSAYDPLRETSWTNVEGTVSVGYVNGGNIVSQTFYDCELGNTTTSNTASYPLAFLAFNRSNQALPAGSQVIVSGINQGWQKEYKTSGSNTAQYAMFTVDNIKVWCATSSSASSASLCTYDTNTGMWVTPKAASYFYVTFRMNNTTFAYNSLNIRYLGEIHLYWNMPDAGTYVTVQNDNDNTQTLVDTMTDTTGSDTVTSDVTSQYTQQVEGLQLFQFVENLDETFANTLTTQETDSSVHFPGMNLAGFQIPAANVDPLQLVPADLVTPIKMIVTFTFCSAFISHIISLLHAIFEIYDYANGVWVDAGTEGDRVTSAVTLSGWE